MATDARFTLGDELDERLRLDSVSPLTVHTNMSTSLENRQAQRESASQGEGDDDSGAVINHYHSAPISSSSSSSSSHDISSDGEEGVYDDDSAPSSSSSSSSNSRDISSDGEERVYDDDCDRELAPVALNPEHVPEEIICSICLTIPLEPIITPCEHVFCRGCIHRALDRAKRCPVDRTPCTQGQLQPLRGVVQRIWNNTQVICQNHGQGCAWKGSIGDYAGHAKKCAARMPRNAADILKELEQLKMKVTTLQTENDRLEDKNSHLRSEIEDLVDTFTYLQGDNYDLIEKNNRLRLDYNDLVEVNDDKRRQIKSLQREIRRLKERQENLDAEEGSAFLRHRACNQQSNLFNGTYNYRRENVVELSQLISMHVLRKPENIDRNRIFNCVRSCYLALQKEYEDNNPQQYRANVKMLLTTCQATTWFTDRQQDNFRSWYREQFSL